MIDEQLHLRIKLITCVSGRPLYSAQSYASLPLARIVDVSNNQHKGRLTVTTKESGSIEAGIFQLANAADTLTGDTRTRLVKLMQSLADLAELELNVDEWLMYHASPEALLGWSIDEWRAYHASPEVALGQTHEQFMRARLASAELATAK
jgi:hypothetical protein